MIQNLYHFFFVIKVFWINGNGTRLTEICISKLLQIIIIGSALCSGHGHHKFCQIIFRHIELECICKCIGIKVHRASQCFLQIFSNPAHGRCHNRFKSTGKLRGHLTHSGCHLCTDCLKNGTGICTHGLTHVATHGRADLLLKTIHIDCLRKSLIQAPLSIIRLYIIHKILCHLCRICIILFLCICSIPICQFLCHSLQCVTGNVEIYISKYFIGPFVYNCIGTPGL